MKHIVLDGMKPHSTQENVGFQEHDREIQEVSRGVADPLAQLPLARDATLGDFLSRPIQIWTVEWSPDANVTQVIYPWSLFFLNPRVENRICNFKLVRCNLCVRFMVNGNSFYSGRLLVNYNPLETRDDYVWATGTNIARMVRLSQRQHIYIDPCTSAGGCLKLPFMFDREFMDVTDLDAEAQEMGSISISTPAQLRLSTDNASVKPVTVSVFAWATDVTIGGLTHTNLDGLSPQASPVADETGMKISTLAHTASVAIGLFGKIPGVGLYAKATQVALSAAGDLAKMFGFSRPTAVEQPVKYEPRPTSSLATCIGSDNAEKLTVDPKQEVSIDPKIWGDPSVDQLEIVNIAKTWSLLTTFEWQSDRNVGQMLFNTVVDPCVVHRIPGDDPICLTPVAGVTLPFRYWSGSLRFKIDIVACAFHRGRLAVVYDPHETPHVMVAGIPVPTYEANTNYNEIIDISDNRCCEFSISNMQTQSLRKHLRPGITDSSFPAGAEGGYSSTNPIVSTMLGDIGNGTLSFFVVNELTTPNSVTTSVDVLVSIRADDDFRVYDPTDDLRYYSLALRPQASPLEPIPLDMGKANPVYHFGVRRHNNNLADVYVGENVLSIRTLLKRYIAYMTLSSIVPGHFVGNLMRFKHAMYPLMYLYSNNTVHQDVALNGINFVGHTYVAYFRSAFLAMRGGMRWKLTPLSPQISHTDGIGFSQLSVNRRHDVSYSPMADIVLLSGLSTLPRSGAIATHHSPVGEAITINTVNDTLEFETPFQSNFKFVMGSSSEQTKVSDRVSGFQITGNEYSFGENVLLYAAASEDFTLGHFIGFPIIYYRVTLPDAAP